MLTLEEFLYPIIAVMGLAFLFSSILRVLHESRHQPTALGILFGGAVFVTIAFSQHLGLSIGLEVQALIVGIAVLYGGMMAGAVTMAIGLGSFAFLANPNLLAPMFSLVAAFGVAILWRQFVASKQSFAILSDAGFGLCIGMLMVVENAGLAVFGMKVAPASSVQILGTALASIGIGIIFRREIKFLEDARALEKFAKLDPLTKLLNRRGAEDRLTRLKLKPKNGAAMFYMDVDLFKQINDQHGHAAGDLALLTIARRLSNAVRGEAIVSRQGGDEFLIFIPDIARSGIETLAERFRNAISSTPIKLEGAEIPLSISVGAFWTDQTHDFETMRNAADSQLSRAKIGGRNRVAIGVDGECDEDADGSRLLWIAQDSDVVRQETRN